MHIIWSYDTNCPWHFQSWWDQFLIVTICWVFNNLEGLGHMPVYVGFSVCTHHRCFYYVLYHSLLLNNSWVYVTCGMYRPYDSVLTPKICASLKNIQDLFLCSLYCVPLPFDPKSFNYSRIRSYCSKTSCKWFSLSECNIMFWFVPCFHLFRP